MPQVLHSYRGENRHPRLKLPKSERAILMNAADLLRAIEQAVTGHQPALADDLHKTSDRLRELAKVEEMDLSKPPF